MFRKPKKLKTAGIRRRTSDDNNDNDDDDNDEKDRKRQQEELMKAKKRAKKSKNKVGHNDDDNDNNDTSTSTSSNKQQQQQLQNVVMHQYETTKGGPGRTQQDLVTSTNEHHPTKTTGSTTNKFLAGPIKATANIRTTCRFDYQPDICKDYKDTGFCGFGDTCIYLHDRGDTLSGWQLEQQWQQQQESKKQKQEEAMTDFMNQHTTNSKIGGSKNNDNNNATTLLNDDDGIPFACYVCREYFKDPQVTNCGHYFCNDCIMQHIKTVSTSCPICNKDTHNVFHEPTKLLSKKRKIFGKNATWEDYMDKLSSPKQE